VNFRINIKLLFYPIVILLIGFIIACKQEPKHEISLFAAAGTMLPCNEICDSAVNKYNVVTEKNYAASGAMARQIHAGARADIFISANKQWVDFLEDNELIIKDKITKIAENKLVIICPTNKNIELEFSQQFDINSAIPNNISIGDPKYVPVGKYAKQVMDSLQWFEKIRKKIILAKDVTSVLHYVELGECDWGIVYYSEALKSDKVKIVYEVPQQLYSPIHFYMALTNETDQSKKIYHFFKTNQAKSIFVKHGFITNNQDTLDHKP